MYIHCNTNQTILPLELSACLPHNHVVFTIEQVVQELDERYFDRFYHEAGRSSYHPKLTVPSIVFMSMKKWSPPPTPIRLSNHLY